MNVAFVWKGVTRLSHMSKANKIKYTTIHIPVALGKLIDELIESGEFAFASRSEFVKDAIRRSLEKHGFYPSKSWLTRNLANEAISENLNERIRQLKELRAISLSNESQQ